MSEVALSLRRPRLAGAAGACCHDTKTPSCAAPALFPGGVLLRPLALWIFRLHNGEETVVQVRGGVGAASIADGAFGKAQNVHCTWVVRVQPLPVERRGGEVIRRAGRAAEGGDLTIRR